MSPQSSVPASDSRVEIKALQPSDFDDFISLICALADFEELDRPASDAIARLRADAFGDRPRYEAYLARRENGQAVGYCILFETYSSFLARPTLYLEDVFVLPEARRNGIGQQFLRHIASLADSRECGRIEWQVLDWNENAIKFYNRLGAAHMKEWYPYRMTRDQYREFLHMSRNKNDEG